MGVIYEVSGVAGESRYVVYKIRSVHAGRRFRLRGIAYQ
jgi:hypothetical protein